MHGQISVTADSGSITPRWPAVYALFLGVFSLITAEFLPMSLLTPMARDLGISEGLAGQGVTATAVVALFSGLLIATFTSGIDRRHVLLGFSILLIVSNLLVSGAVNFPMLLAGRLLLGVAIGGFWAISAAVAIRLVPANDVPKALSVIFSGISLATVIATPLGSWLGDVIGWRAVFFYGAVFGFVGLVAQWATLPSMTSTSSANLRTLYQVLKRPGMLLGMACLTLVFTGHFALFTFIRPFIETALDASVNWLTVFLLGFGVASFLGTLLAGPLLKRSLTFTLVAMPLVAGASALALSALTTASVLSLVLVALWGMAAGSMPVAWTTWTTRIAPDEVESAGGLNVTAVQFAIALGAASGGILFDMTGASGVYLYGGAVLIAAGAIIAIGVRNPAPIAD